jgi:hypothetical protein
MDINIGVKFNLGNLKGAAGQISNTLLGEQRKIEAGNRSAGKSFDSISQGAKKSRSFHTAGRISRRSC